MKRTQRLLVLLLALAYTSQALAGVVLPCAGMAYAAAEASGTDTASSAHAGHHMPADKLTNTEPMTADCCEGGLCAVSHCQSAAALPLSGTTSVSGLLAHYPGIAHTGSPAHPIDSLYRPPISR